VAESLRRIGTLTTDFPGLQFLDLRTGKRSIVPESQGLIGGQWVSENTLVAAPTNQAKLEIFDVRTQKWSDLVPGKLTDSVVNWVHSPDYKYVYLNYAQNSASS